MATGDTRPSLVESAPIALPTPHTLRVGVRSGGDSPPVRRRRRIGTKPLRLAHWRSDAAIRRRDQLTPPRAPPGQPVPLSYIRQQLKIYNAPPMCGVRGGGADVCRVPHGWEGEGVLAYEKNRGAGGTYVSSRLSRRTRGEAGEQVSPARVGAGALPPRHSVRPRLGAAADTGRHVAVRNATPRIEEITVRSGGRLRAASAHALVPGSRLAAEGRAPTWVPPSKGRPTRPAPARPTGADAPTGRGSCSHSWIGVHNGVQISREVLTAGM